MLREILPQANPGAFIFRALERQQLSLAHGAFDVGHPRFESGVDALERNESSLDPRRDDGLPDNGGAGAGDAGDPAQAFDLGAVVADATGLPDIDMRRRTQDAAAQLALQPGHQRQRDHKGENAYRHADGREERHT